MPCYQVNTVSLDVQAGNLDLLQKATAALGLEVAPSPTGVRSWTAAAPSWPRWLAARRRAARPTSQS
jgi:hypothetical protein